MGLWGRPACRETWWCCGCWELCLASPRPPSDAFVFNLALAGLGPPSLSPSGHLSPPWTSAGPKCPLQDGPEGHCPPRLRQRPPHPRRMVAVAAGPGTRLSLSWPCTATLAVWMAAVPVTVPTTVWGPRVRCGAPVCLLHCHGRYWPGVLAFVVPGSPGYHLLLLSLGNGRVAGAWPTVSLPWRPLSSSAASPTTWTLSWSAGDV